MKEFDLDSAKRKFENTLMFYENPDKSLNHGYCYKIVRNNDNLIYLINPAIQTETPVYHAIPNGFYANNVVPCGHTLVIRRPDKTYKIGICSQTHIFLIPNENNPLPNKHWEYTNIASPLLITENLIEEALKNQGPISRTLWLNPTSVYYLNKKVGNRKGTKFIVNDSIKTHLKTLLENFKPTFWV